MKTLESLFFGDDAPFELPSINREKYRRLLQQFGESEDTLVESMTEEQQKMYENSMDT